jgi:hypothetical protein
MSQSQTPLIYNVIPLFDIITRALDDHISNDTLPSAIRMAARRGHAMLNKYYGLTDASIIYRIAMCMCVLDLVLRHNSYTFLPTVLHPRYKSSYFHKAGWPRSWITTAEDLLRAEWDANYKPQAAEPGVASVVCDRIFTPLRPLTQFTATTVSQ